jgi:vesicle coat complex subunit
VSFNLALEHFLLNNPNVIFLEFSIFTCRIKEFSEWAQCIVLELASKFLPSDNNEIFDIMNLLEDRLQHANGAVVLATIKVFLHLTMSMTDVHQQVHILLPEIWFGYEI